MYTNQVTKDEARRKLNIEPQKRVISYIGNIRPYKNVPLLIKTFRQLQDSEILLVISGRSSSVGLADEIFRAAGNDPNVKICLNFVPATEMQFYLKAADLIVLPYEGIFNSGSALLALSFDVPVMLPKTEVMLELQSQVGKDWVLLYDGKLTPDSMIAGLLWALQHQRPTRAPLDFLNWKRIAAQTLEVYAAI
jgi:glycosyltransferase involved in cell wall biosynthesis